MATNRNRLVLGSIAIVGGLLALLANMGFYTLSELGAGLLTGLVGLAFLGFYAVNRERWWALIPGVVLLTMGGVIIVARYGDSDLAGVMTLGGVGLAFVAVLLARPGAWWALIPAGVMFSLAGVTFADEFLGVRDSAAVLFFGLAATFAVLSLVRRGERRMRWALVPAVALGLLGTLAVLGRPDLFNLVWPVGLILGGAFYALRGGASGQPQATDMR